MTQTQKTADGATPEGTGVQAEKRVDVEGVGGVSGDPLNGIKHENVEKAMEQKGGPSTDTWSGNEGDSLGQQDGVTTETTNELGGPIGSPVSKVVEGDFPGGDGAFPDHDPTHVDLQGNLLEEVGEGTKTFPSDEMHVGQPVTDENGNDIGGPIGTPIKAPLSAFQAAANAVKLAETEIELGVLKAEAKWDRIAELEDASPTEVVAELRAYAKVKTARVAAKATATKTAGATSMPSLRPMTHVAGFDPSDHGVEDLNTEDSLW
jgi:hypothetical protein